MPAGTLMVTPVWVAVTLFVTMPELLTVLNSPATVAVLVMERGASEAILTLTVTEGAEPTLAGMAVDLTQLTNVVVLAVQSQVEPVTGRATVRPVGRLSLMV